MVKRSIRKRIYKKRTIRFGKKSRKSNVKAKTRRSRRGRIYKNRGGAALAAMRAGVISMRKSRQARAGKKKGKKTKLNSAASGYSGSSSDGGRDLSQHGELGGKDENELRAIFRFVEWKKIREWMMGITIGSVKPWEEIERIDSLIYYTTDDWEDWSYDNDGADHPEKVKAERQRYEAAEAIKTMCVDNLQDFNCDDWSNVYDNYKTVNVWSTEKKESTYSDAIDRIGKGLMRNPITGLFDVYWGDANPMYR